MPAAVGAGSSRSGCRCKSQPLWPRSTGMRANLQAARCSHCSGLGQGVSVRGQRLLMPLLENGGRQPGRCGSRRQGPWWPDAAACGWTPNGLALFGSASLGPAVPRIKINLKLTAEATGPRNRHLTWIRGQCEYQHAIRRRRSWDDINYYPSCCRCHGVGAPRTSRRSRHVRANAGQSR